MVRAHRLALVAALALAPAAPAQTWMGAVNTDWNTAGNWSPATVPNSSTAAVTFGNAATNSSGNIVVNISSSVSAQSLSFTNTTGNYAIEASANQTLSNVQSISMAAGVPTVDGIYLSSSSPSTGDLLFPTANNLTITNNCTTQAGLLAFEQNTVIGTPGTGGVFVAGPGQTVFQGSFAASPNNLVGGLTKTGPGTFDYVGSGASLGGNLVLDGGVLNLVYVFSTATKLNNGELQLGGGQLVLWANSGTATTQSIPGNTFFIAGHTDISAVETGTIALAAGAITRSAGATTDISPSSGALTFGVTTSTGNTNGLLGSGPAFATVNGGSTWATVSAGTITGLTTYGVNTFTSGTNTDLTASEFVQGNFNVNSLRFNTGNQSLQVEGSFNLQSGGILVTPNATGGTIYSGLMPGTLVAGGSGELIVHQYGTGNFTISCAISASGGLTKSGPGTLILSGSNTGLTGPINVNRGSLTVTTPAAVNSAGAINFNDDRYNDPIHNAGPPPQVFTVDLGNGVNGTISPPVLLSAFSFSDYGTYFSTGASTSSTVTLGGVISSAAGLTTPLRLTTNGSDTSGFDVTNVNTFTGNVSLQHGFLGINSDASLGNAANTLVLEVNDTVNGGLVFLNGGITDAHAVLVNQPTRIVCNWTDSNTISSAISGAGAIYKDGTGTLTLTNAANSFTGGVTVSAGTLSLGSTGGLSAGTNLTVAAGATFTAATTTSPTQFGTIALNGGTFQATGTGQGIGVNQITTSAAGGTVNFTGAGADTLNFQGTNPAITINGNSTWPNPANATTIANAASTTLFITIAPGVTLNNGIALISAGQVQITGGGTLTLSNANNSFANGVTVNAGTLSLGSAGGLPNGTNITVNSGATFIPAMTGAVTFGTITLSGGTFQSPAFSPLSDFLVTQIVATTAGGTVDYSAVINAAIPLEFAGSGAAIMINGNSTWLSPGNNVYITNFGGGSLPITIVPGVTLTNGLALNNDGGFRVSGGGTLFQNSDTTNVVDMFAPITVVQSTFRVTDATTVVGGQNVGNLGTGTFTLDGGTFDYGGRTATTSKPIAITANGATIEVEGAAALTANGAITGPGPLTKTGPGILILGSTSNSFTSVTIAGGTLGLSSDANLGAAAASVTVTPFGALLYTATTTTARTQNLNNGTLSVSGGATLTLNGAAIGGGFMNGAGTFALTGGTTLAGVTTAGSATLSVTGPASFLNFSNGSALNIAAGLAAPTPFSLFTNQGSGSITVGAVSVVDANNFQTYGMLTLNPAVVGSGQFTELINTGTSPMYFNGGSRTFIGTAATAINPMTGQPADLAGINLNGQNAVVAGGLLVNNGFVVDGGPTGTATIVADFGSLVKGAGFFQNSVITQNGGKFQAGNSPGAASFGQFVFGPGGVNNYVFAIDDATGTAGPSPDALGHVSGWGLVKAIQQAVGSVTSSGDFTWTATSTDKLTVAIDTLVNPTTVGADVTGPMADFDPSQAYSWPAVRWSGTYSGPTDAATLNADTAFDTSGFVNPITGTFGWSLSGSSLSLSYTPTPVPEPGTLALTGIAAIGWVTFWRRRWKPAAGRKILRLA